MYVMIIKYLQTKPKKKYVLKKIFFSFVNSRHWTAIIFYFVLFLECFSIKNLKKKKKMQILCNQKCIWAYLLEQHYHQGAENNSEQRFP